MGSLLSCVDSPQELRFCVFLPFSVIVHFFQRGVSLVDVIGLAGPILRLICGHTPTGDGLETDIFPRNRSASILVPRNKCSAVEASVGHVTAEVH